MADVSRVQQLHDELLDSESTPEVVCGDCPELLPEVRQRWRQMRIIEAELEALFPTLAPYPDAVTSTPWHAGADLPRVPGYEVEALLGRGGMVERLRRARADAEMVAELEEVLLLMSDARKSQEIKSGPHYGLSYQSSSLTLTFLYQQSLP
jgi:hypothetical protein